MSDDLTPKQMLFARSVAAGMSLSDAYREAYNVGERTKGTTVNQKASQLAKREHVRDRINQLVAAREQGILRSSLGDREKVLDKFRLWTDGTESPSKEQLKAAELLGKAAGLFKDRPDDDDSDMSGHSAAEIRQELARRLQALVGSDIDGEYTVVDAQKEAE